MANCSTTTGKRVSLHVYVTLIRRAKLQQLASFKKKISEFNNSQSKNYAWIAGNWVLVRGVRCGMVSSWKQSGEISGNWFQIWKRGQIIFAAL
jgi:hypothetical protein